MKNLIISPHTDDAIFSLGNYIQTLEDVTVLSPFAGVPEDPMGKRKHTTLRHDHEQACKLMGIEVVNGEFLDDVYPDRNLGQLQDWLREKSQGYDAIYIPLGIHHPDHVLIRQMFTSSLTFTHFYEELPYRVIYPQLVASLREMFLKETAMQIIIQNTTTLKKQAVLAYTSEVNGGEILQQLFTREIIWKK